MFVQPGNGAYLGPATKGLVVTGNVDWLGVTHKDLAGEIDAKATVFQTTLRDTTLKERALAAGCQP